MLIRCLPLSVRKKSGPAQFCPRPSTKYNWCWKIWGGEKTDRVGKKLTGYFFLPGKKLTSQFLPRGRNGPAWSFPGERLAGGKNWPLHRQILYRKWLEVIKIITNRGEYHPEKLYRGILRYGDSVLRCILNMYWIASKVIEMDFWSTFIPVQ